MTFLSGLATKAGASNPWLVTGHNAKSAAVIWPYEWSLGVIFETPNDTGEMVALAVRLGERLWRDGFRYSNAA